MLKKRDILNSVVKQWLEVKAFTHRSQTCSTKFILNSRVARFQLNDSDLHFIYEIEDLRKLNLIGSVQIGNVTSYRESWRFMKLPYIMHYIKING